MTDYEILLMLDPELPDERQTQIVDRAREAIEERDGGRWDKHEPWGRRRLAYEIDHKNEGSYHLLTFAAEPATPPEDPRAEELRRRLEESRTVAEEQHEQAASAEVPVDAVAEPESGEVADRRRSVHERARAAAEEMHGGGPDGE